ncbi:MAG TPA: hypothetical protein VKT32_17500 [Chthonomonadaceae bacterium]|nr:hypothetical protein [Chthonomonadaceae bacterium]
MHYGWRVLALAAGIALVGCGKMQERIKGIAPAAEVSATVHDLNKAPATKRVVVRGEMIEKCPVAGCWFLLRDKTGVVRVDTKAAGFVVSDVPLHTTMTVAGKVTPGAQPGIAATGIRY